MFKQKEYKKYDKLALSLLLTTSLLCGCGQGGVPATSDNLSNGGTSSIVVQTDSSALDESYQISDTLYGLFVEDINHAIDGGMYAELVKNRSFEYGKQADGANKHGWTSTVKEDGFTFEVMDGATDQRYLHEQNTHYARLTYQPASKDTAESFAGIYNKGYLAGMSLDLDASYTLSFYTRSASYDGRLRITLMDAKGTVYFQDYVSDISDSWSKKELAIVPTNATASGAVTMRLCVEIEAGSVDLDMISLMPKDTYKGTNIRKDIGEMIEALNPSFLRFPGGCVIEGKDLESMYSWKDSIGNGATLTVDGETTTGDVAVRPQGRSIWSGTKQHPYYTSYGIGFYEFFELCDILDCLPVPVLNAGMTCQVQSPKYIVYSTDSDEFKQCIQDALDLVEFCRGGADTYWGSVRIAMGHEEPFELKYISIGNEQWQTEYFQHYRLFVEAFQKAAEENPALYGDIELCVANSTSSGDTVGWNYVEDCADFGDYTTTLVDEHYYESPSFFFTNTHRYDSYDRTSQAKVFLGEYAAQSNTLQAALAEAAYMTGLEKNGDIVEMACYAPLFGNRTQSQWTPDLMWFDNQTIYGSVNYYVQQLYSLNKGTINLPTTLDLGALQNESTLSGGAGLASWMTSVAYDNVVITDNATGKVLYENDFEDDSWEKDFDEHRGNWKVQDGMLVQTNTASPADTNTGDAIYFGDTSWSNYTLTVEGKILSGAEGFLIPVCVTNSSNNIFWNLGGWGNTVSCLQIVSGGSKSGQVSGTVKNMVLKKNTTYTIKIVVDGMNIKCYLDDKLYIDYIQVAPQALYETASVDANGDILLKLVNTTENVQSIAYTLQDFDPSCYEATATVTVLSGETLNDVNTFDNPTKMAPYETTVVVSDQFTYEAPKYSVSIIRIKKK